MSGHRGERVGHRIQEIVARLLARRCATRIGFVTLTGVEVQGPARGQGVRGGTWQRGRARAGSEWAEQRGTLPPPRRGA